MMSPLQTIDLENTMDSHNISFAFISAEAPRHHHNNARTLLSRCMSQNTSDPVSSLLFNQSKGKLVGTQVKKRKQKGWALDDDEEDHVEYPMAMNELDKKRKQAVDDDSESESGDK
jgi:hypothetical protein